METYDDIFRILKEAEGSSDYEQMLAMLQDSFGETVRDFCTVRQYVMDIATLPDVDVNLEDTACGSAPFVIEDGETNYAVIWADGQVSPLPLGFEVAEDDLNIDDDTILMNRLAPGAPSGLIRFVPVNERLKMPGEEAFELERVIDLAVVDQAMPLTNIHKLKETALNLVESEPAKKQMAELIEQIEKAAEGDAELLEQLLENVIEQGRSSKDDNQAEMEKSVPLLEATAEGDVCEIGRLLDSGAEWNIDTPAFVYAILNDQPEAFEVYVEHGVDVSEQFDMVNEDGSTLYGVNAMILAAAGGTMWALQRLLELGVDPNYETPMGQTALEVAVAGGQDEVVDVLFDKMTDVLRPSAGRVLVAAAMAGNTEVASRCLDVGIPVDATDNRGWTALKYAVSNGNRETTEVLLERGADSNIADNEGWTPLLTAIENRDLEFVDLLLSKGANPNLAPDIEGMDDQKGFSALMRAAHYGEVEILESLIGAGADLAQTDSDGTAAIHYAALHRQPDCLEVLLNQGVDPNVLGEDGFSPIGWFIVGLAVAHDEDAVIDEDEAIAVLNLLLKSGGKWEDTAQQMVTDGGDGQIPLVDVAIFTIEELGLKGLLAIVTRLSV